MIKQWRKLRLSIKILLVSVVILIGARIALPYVVLHFVNQELASLPTYTGHVDDVDIQLWRGAYRLKQVTIKKRKNTLKTPLLNVKTLDISVLWSAVFKGQLVAQTIFEQAEIHLVDDPDVSGDVNGDQTGVIIPWVNLVDKLVPLRLDWIEAKHTELHFHNFKADPPVDLYMTDLNILVKNITNSRELSKELEATVMLSGNVMATAPLTLNGRFDPNRDRPRFDLNLKLQKLNLANIGNVLNAYAPFDIEQGELDLVIEAAASKGRVDGYVKPLFKGLDVLSWEGDVVQDKDNLFRLFVEAMGGIISEVLENQSRDQFATRIPLTGQIDEPDVNAWVAIKNIFTNAFISAFNPTVENRIDLDSVENDSNNDSNAANSNADDNATEQDTRVNDFSGPPGKRH